MREAVSGKGLQDPQPGHRQISPLTRGGGDEVYVEGDGVGRMGM